MNVPSQQFARVKKIAHKTKATATAAYHMGRLYETQLTRSRFHWFQHEPCWFVRKRNAPSYRKAGENSTIWDSPSLKFIMGGADEAKWDHPTQKPVDLMRRPILNRLRRGELIYDPFLGSGTTLAAAELTERVCYGIELDPRYVDVIVQRWQQLTGRKATLDGDGRRFDEIARISVFEFSKNSVCWPTAQL